jgi:hypothetical protein
VASDGRHDFVVTGKQPGPMVFRNCRATMCHNDIGPHQRWTTGVLWEQISANRGQKLYADDGNINLRNRGNSGSGHGWGGRFNHDVTIASVNRYLPLRYQTLSLTLRSFPYQAPTTSFGTALLASSESTYVHASAYLLFAFVLSCSIRACCAVE